MLRLIHGMFLCIINIFSIISFHSIDARDVSCLACLDSCYTFHKFQTFCLASVTWWLGEKGKNRKGSYNNIVYKLGEGVRVIPKEMFILSKFIYEWKNTFWLVGEPI